MPPKTALSAQNCTYRTTDSQFAHSEFSTYACSHVLPPTPSFPPKSPKHIFGKTERTKTKGTPPSTMAPPSTMTNIQGEELPSPSHNVLSNPPEPYKVKAHNGIVESAKKWYISS